MNNILNIIDGKKTYIVAALTLAAAAAQYFGVVVPDYVWTIFAACGLGSIRSAVSKVGAKDLADAIPVAVSVAEDVVQEATSK